MVEGPFGSRVAAEVARGIWLIGRLHEDDEGVDGAVVWKCQPRARACGIRRSLRYDTLHPKAQGNEEAERRTEEPKSQGKLLMANCQ